MNYIGIDHHKQYLIALMMNQEGKIIRRDRVSMDRESIRSYIERVNGDGKLKVAIEASYGWEYIYDELKEVVKEVKVAHPLKTRAIAEAKIKTDSLDAEVLAHLLRADLIAEAYAPDFQTRDRKNFLRYRVSLVKIRTMLKNKIHSILARNHIEDVDFRKLSDKFGKRGREYIRKFKLKGNDTEIVRHYLELIELIEEKILLVDKEIKEMVDSDEICKLLDSIPGIGGFSAVLIRYEIDDIERFPSAKKLCSYAGLVPSTYSTGGKTYHGKITKQGNRWLRWILVEAAQRAIMKDMYLRRYYKKVAGYGGNNKATIAVARKLLSIVYRIWKERRPYYERYVAVALSEP